MQRSVISALIQTCAAVAAIAASAAATPPTLTAGTDNRTGTLFANDFNRGAAGGGYNVAPAAAYQPVNFFQTINDGSVVASLNSQSSWLNLGPGNTTDGFTVTGTATCGGSLAISSDVMQIGFNISGLQPGQLMPFHLTGSWTKVLATGTVTLTGPNGFNSSIPAALPSWNLNLNLGNGTYTLALNMSAQGQIGWQSTISYSVTMNRAPMPPLNDLCQYPTSISTGTTPIDTSAATGITFVPASCAPPAGLQIWNDLFYKYAATGTGIATVSMCGQANFDTRLAVVIGGCGSDNFIACNDDGPGCPNHTSTISFPTVCGEVYTIIVGGANGAVGQGSLNITQTGGCIDVPHCDDAFPVYPGWNNVSNTYGWVGDVVVPSSCGMGGDSTIHNASFWKYRAVSNAAVSISTCQSENPFDTRLAVFSGTCTTPTWLGCNDNTCGQLSGLAFPATCGEEYTIVFGSAEGTTGVAILNVTQAGPVCNDVITNPLEVFVGNNSVANIGATGTTFVSPDCNFADPWIYQDVFYKFVPPATGLTTVSTCGVNFQSRLQVMADSEPYIPITCNDYACGHGGASVTFAAVAGQAVLIALGSDTPFETGIGEMLITQESPCPADLSGNGSIGAEDLAMLLGQWGGTGSGDLSGNGSVGPEDLAMLLGAWGGCV